PPLHTLRCLHAPFNYFRTRSDVAISPPAITTTRSHTIPRGVGESMSHEIQPNDAQVREAGHARMGETASRRFPRRQPQPIARTEFIASRIARLAHAGRILSQYLHQFSPHTSSV